MPNNRLRPTLPFAIPFALALLLTLTLATPAGAETLTEEIRQSYDLAAGGTVDLSNVNGSVTVETWDRNQVELHVEKKVKAGSRADAEKAMEAFEVEIEAGRDHLRVETRKPRDGSDGILSWLFGNHVQYSADFRLKVPRRADVRAESVNGHVRVEGVDGAVDAETVNGGVTLAAVSGDAETSTVNGSIRVRDARGSVSASSVNGRIDVELAAVTPGADMRFSSTNGGVSLRLPGDVRTHLKARSTNGGIRSDFPVEIRGRHSKSVDAELNGGGPGRVEIRTTNGGIRIERL